MPNNQKLMALLLLICFLSSSNKEATTTAVKNPPTHLDHVFFTPIVAGVILVSRLSSDINASFNHPGPYLSSHSFIGINL